MEAFSKSDLANLTEENGFTVVEDGDLYEKPVSYYYIKTIKNNT